MKIITVLGFISSIVSQKKDFTVPDTKLSQQFSATASKISTVTKMNQATIIDIKRYAWYASAATCEDDRLNSWDCKSCLKVTIPNQLHIFENTTAETKGFLAIDEPTKDIIISFRGSNTTANIMVNGNIVMTPIRDKIKVHTGFLETTQSLLEPLTEILLPILDDEKYQNYTITFTGHSLGANIASLMGFQLNDIHSIPWPRIKLITFGQMRTGNIDFAQFYNQQPLRASARVVNGNDRCPHLFQDTLTYAHHQNEVFVPVGKNQSAIYCDNTVLEDPNCSNSVPAKTYSDIVHLQLFDTFFGARGC